MPYDYEQMFFLVRVLKGLVFFFFGGGGVFSK